MSKAADKKKPAAGGKKNAAASGSKDAAAVEKTPALILVTEEDDEFEEFEDADWTGQAEEKEAHIKQQWQDDWDIDDADDDFCNQLRKELQKSA